MVRRITARAPISDEELDRRLLTAVEERALAKQYATVVIPAIGSIEEVYHSVYEYIKTYL
jgi:dephospho-CoA kinase